MVVLIRLWCPDGAPGDSKLSNFFHLLFPRWQSGASLASHLTVSSLLPSQTPQNEIFYTPHRASEAAAEAARDPTLAPPNQNLGSTGHTMSWPRLAVLALLLATAEAAAGPMKIKLRKKAVDLSTLRQSRAANTTQLLAGPGQNQKEADVSITNFMNAQVGG